MSGVLNKDLNLIGHSVTENFALHLITPQQMNFDWSKLIVKMANDQLLFYTLNEYKKT